MTFNKTIDPSYEIDGRRKRLVGYIGQITDESGVVLHSYEYSTHSQAENGLNAIVYDLLMDYAERGLVDTVPTCTTCGNDGDCPDCATPLFDDVARVIDMALGNAPAKDVVPELRRVRARLAEIAAERGPSPKEIAAHMASVYIPNWQPAVIAADDLPY